MTTTLDDRTSALPVPPRPTRADMLAAVARLEPAIRAAAPAIEQDRRVPDEIVAELYDVGVFRSFTPREVGGPELDPNDWLDVVEELSRINGSVGWLAMILAGHTFLPKEVLEGYLAQDGFRLIQGTNGGRAAGRAHRVEGGYRVTGRWPFASGSPWASLAGGVSFLYDDDGQLVIHPKDGLPWIVLGVAPSTDWTYHDTWDGLGLRGTGSGDIEFDDVFIPEERCVQNLNDWPFDGPLYRSVLLFQIAGHAAHALGLAQAALDEFVRLANQPPKPGSMRQATLGRQQSHQMVVARADAQIRAARLLVHKAVADAFAAAQPLPRGGNVPLELRVLLRESTTYAVRTGKEVVTSIFDITGAGAVKKGSMIEQSYRDVSVAASHIMHSEATLALSGQYWLTRDRPDGPEIEGGTMAFF